MELPTCLCISNLLKLTKFQVIYPFLLANFFVLFCFTRGLATSRLVGAIAIAAGTLIGPAVIVGAVAVVVVLVLVTEMFYWWF